MQMLTIKRWCGCIIKVDFMTKNKDKHFITIKEPIHQKNVTILNSYVPININFKIHSLFEVININFKILGLMWQWERLVESWGNRIALGPFGKESQKREQIARKGWGGKI